ncbi:MAG: hypothetical protein JJE10_09480 [Thermoleophilia bacterium]|nr:hypothetical protein [Thermoleophilia bacterium]
MEAFDPSVWTDFFVASAGASAALAGLVFVSISINVERILEVPGLPEFALVTVLLLLQALVVSLFGLIPDQDVETLGLEILIGFLVWAGVAGSMIYRSLAHMQTRLSLVSRLLLPVLGSLPILIGAVVLLGGSGEEGLGWIAGGIIGSTVAAVINSWVLLIEIRR